MVNACHTVPAEPSPRPPGGKGSPPTPGWLRGAAGSAEGALPRARGGCRVLRGRGEGTFRRSAGAVVVLRSPQVNHEVI